MTGKRNQSEHWPSDQWHPAYDSIKDWLENEAPVSSPLVINALTNQRNIRPRFRIIRRKT